MSADAQGQGFLSNLLEQKGALDDLKLDFAVASGQVSKGAADQTKALNTIADAFIAGKLSAQESAAAVKSGNRRSIRSSRYER